MSSNSPSIIKEMMAAGMTLARIKMLELAEEDCREMISNIRKANDEFSKSIGRLYPCPIALYLKGPDIRIGSLKDVDQFILKQILGIHSCIQEIRKSRIFISKKYFKKILITRCIFFKSI